MVRVEVTDEGGPPGDPFGPADASEVVGRAARATLRDRGIEEAELSLVLIDDAAMTELNRKWKGRDATTDVLAFALHGSGETPLGDVYIGWEQALRQAADEGEAPARELARLAIHGTLHVLGWNHPDEGREGSEMWQHQERILDGLGINE